jgi:wobble nucleotide-excising tRNase
LFFVNQSENICSTKPTAMIKRIELLKCFGIFQNFKASDLLSDFSKFNLIYGWNGSGKSTLSKLFASIEKKQLDEDFKGCEFKIQTDDQTITQQNITTIDLTVRVFNQDFIKSNIEWDKKVNSILVIAEDKIEDRKKLEELQKEAFKITNQGKELLQEQEHINKQISSFYSSSAKTIKESFKVIDTKDTYYFNYDKTKFEKFVEVNAVKVLDLNSVLREAERQQLVKSIQPVEKEEIHFEIPTPVLSEFEECDKEILRILSKDVIAKIIERLRNNPEINEWVRSGLTIHTKDKIANCEFCGQPLLEERIKELRGHFNDAYSQIVNEINTAAQSTDALELQNIDFPDSSSFYQEFQEHYLKAKENLLNERAHLLSILKEWKEALQNKNRNPFEQFALAEYNVGSIIANYVRLKEDLKELLLKHNTKCQNFSIELDSQKKKLELHYSAELIQKSELKDWIYQKTKLEGSLVELRKQLTQKNKEIKTLETQLIDEAKGADQFNKYLHKFLGRTDISLHFNQEEKGYNILRGRQRLVARNLSEGEKTAIAFVYFVIKLQERGNDIGQSIIVVDDPISSFDSNHLFHSYAFLKNSCEKAKQLFILTHNFQYFRLIRDWIDKKNSIKRNADGSREEVIKSRYFSIECSTDEERTSFIKNAHETLQKYNSEYHYVFNKMYGYQNDQIDSLDKAYMVGNLCRKLLEGFLTFKFPKARNDFRALMNDSCEDKEILERIYRFINKYSHNQLIEFYDTPVDNLVSEGNSIVKDVFELMKTLDAKHFSEMEEICNN